MGLIGVPEIERDLDDLAPRIVEHPLRNRIADPRDEAGERHALGGEAALEGPRAQPHYLRDGADVRAPVGELGGDDLLHRPAEPLEAAWSVRQWRTRRFGCLAHHCRYPPPPVVLVVPRRSCSTHSSPRVSATRLNRSAGQVAAVSMMASRRS